jgi:hypothetical protein
VENLNDSCIKAFTLALKGLKNGEILEVSIFEVLEYPLGKKFYTAYAEQTSLGGISISSDSGRFQPRT